MEFIKQHKNLVFLLIFSGVCFALSVALVLGSKVVGLDEIIYSTRLASSSESITNLMIGISNVLDPVVLFVGALFLCVIFIFQKRYALAITFLSSIVLALFVSIIFKDFFAISRPPNEFPEVFGSAFPSAHAASVSSLAVFGIVVLGRKIQDKFLRYLMGGFVAILALLVGVSRVYLSVHWLSDVAGGFSLGVFFATLSLLIYARIHKVRHGVYSQVLR
jgi:undecaprenyl-diphosphatase